MERIPATNDLAFKKVLEKAREKAQAIYDADMVNAYLEGKEDGRKQAREGVSEEARQAKKIEMIKSFLDVLDIDVIAKIFKLTDAEIKLLKNM